MVHSDFLNGRVQTTSEMLRHILGKGFYKEGGGDYFAGQ